MLGHKQRLLEQIKFSALMHLPRIETTAVKSVNRQLGFWLMMRLNGDTGVLELGERGKIPITIEDVGLVLGLQTVGDELVVSDPKNLERTKERIKKILMLDEGEMLDLDTIRKVLERDITESSGNSEQDAFVVAAVIYATSYFLAPKGRPPRVNTDILETLVDPSNIYKINWSSYVLKTLKECSKKVKSDLRSQAKTVTLDGCLILLQVSLI